MGQVGRLPYHFLVVHTGNDVCDDFIRGYIAKRLPDGNIVLPVIVNARVLRFAFMGGLK